MSVENKIEKLVDAVKSTAYDIMREELEKKIKDYFSAIDSQEIDDIDDFITNILPKKEKINKIKAPSRSAPKQTPTIEGETCQGIMKSGEKSGQECGKKAKHVHEGKHYCGTHIKSAKKGNTSSSSTTGRYTGETIKKINKASKKVPLSMLDDTDLNGFE